MTGHVVLHDSSQGRWLRFSKPVAIFEATRLTDVVQQLEAVEDAVNRRGLYAAGFLSYEAAPAFDAALQACPMRRPLLLTRPCMFFHPLRCPCFGLPCIGSRK
jgi:hypothetical protein